MDMTGQLIDSMGVHISGDFQDEAGYPADWESGTTHMLQDPLDTNIYSVIVDIPAFQKYEYKFVNGDQFYQVEYVPIESRVGYLFNDNRWLWVDSLANDTTFVGAIQFSQNAPKGLTLMRTVVDMLNESAIAAEGVHVAGSFQGWDAKKTMLYSFGNRVYEIISYMTTGEYEFKYHNGNTLTTSETVPAACALNGHRNFGLTKDTILLTVCFSGCSGCVLGLGTSNYFLRERAYLSPNPSTENTRIHFKDAKTSHSFSLLDAAGKTIRKYENIIENDFLIESENLSKGGYFILIDNENHAPTVLKWGVE